MSRGLVPLLVLAIALGGGWAYVRTREVGAARRRAEQAAERARLPGEFVSRVARHDGSALNWLISRPQGSTALRGLLLDAAARSDDVVYDGDSRMVLVHGIAMPRPGRTEAWIDTIQLHALQPGGRLPVTATFMYAAEPGSEVSDVSFTDTGIVVWWTDDVGRLHSDAVAWAPGDTPPSGTYGR